MIWSSLLLLVSPIISLSLRIGARHHVYLVSPILVPSIMFALCPLSRWPSLCSTCVLCLSDRHHVLLVPCVLVLSIMSILFSLSWCPLSCPPCVPVSVPAIMSTLYPRLVPAIMSTLFPSPVLVPASLLTFFTCLGAHYIKSTLCHELDARHHDHFMSSVLVSTIMSRLCPLSWYPPSSKPYAPALVPLFMSILGPHLGPTLY